jgi:hypothetical protein
MDVEKLVNCIQERSPFWALNITLQHKKDVSEIMDRSLD